DDGGFHPLDVLGGDAEVLRGLLDVRDGLGRVGLALLERELAREVLLALLDEVGDRVTDLRAVPRGERGPLRLRLARRLRRPLDVLLARVRRVGELLARDRRDDLP